MSKLARQRLFQILLPLALVGIALALTDSIPSFKQKGSFFFFITAVMASIWYGGWVSGLAATVYSVVVTMLFVLPAAQAAAVNSADVVQRWVLFILIDVMLISLHAARGRAEQKLRWSEQRLSMAVDSARLGVWDYNLISRTFWWSQTLEKIYGRTDGTFPTSYGQFFACISFDDQPLFNRAITRTIDEGSDYEIEHRIILPDNSARWVVTRGRLFFNEASRAERIVGIVTDITSRKMLEEQQRNMLRRQSEPPLSTVA